MLNIRAPIRKDRGREERRYMIGLIDSFTSEPYSEKTTRPETCERESERDGVGMNGLG